MVFIKLRATLFSQGKFFDEISQDSGRYCFGVEETMKALEMGAVETLVVWENLAVNRYQFVKLDDSPQTVTNHLLFVSLIFHD